MDIAEKLKENFAKFKQNGGKRPKNEDEENFKKTHTAEEILRREFANSDDY